MRVRWLMHVTEGQRVLVTRDLDFYPFFELKKGSTGTVNYVNPERGTCVVMMDEAIEGCEEWNNEVYFNMEKAIAPHGEWYTLQEVCWPLPKEST